jgi:small-conductance mechanosensitive channel
MTPFKVLTVMGIILGGFFLASLINRYVLGRIFMLLPVDLGVQNTIMSITRFLVVLVSILSAFLWADLGTFLIALGLVIGSIGYLVKEPIGDLVSYFIILVQRHIQIGDYVEFNDECGGVVRRITPRSVILRKKNSYTIVVPNSMFVTQTVNNWSYARNYIAFDDILFTVPYKSDPELISKLMKQVLEENVHILKSPAPIVRLELFSDNGFVFMVRGFLTEKNILNKWDIASDIRFAISKKLRENDIHFALPTRAIVQERLRQERLSDDSAN